MGYLTTLSTSKTAHYGAGWGWMQYGMEHLWNDNDKGTPKCVENHLFYYHFVHLKCHSNSPGIEPGPHVV